MRIGLVSYWFNRGQATIARQLRGLLDGLGHETTVLARPTKTSFYRPAYVAEDDVWRQSGVTRASAFLIPASEYIRWAAEHELEAVIFEHTLQLAEIARLRETGVRTIGRFNWEAFGADHVEPARAAFDDVYSLNRCERERYAEFGINSIPVRWGCHPESVFDAGPRDDDTLTYLFPGGYLSRRKPLAEVIDAFSQVGDPRLTLLIKTQGVQHGARPAAEVADGHTGIEVVDGDLTQHEYQALWARADVCVAPSRWEGLGLHLYEATAAGLPVITNDRPPMSEVVEHELNGLLVRSLPTAPAESGIPAWDPEPASLLDALRRLADEDLRARLAAGARSVRDGRLSWEHTVADVRDLLGG